VQKVSPIFMHIGSYAGKNQPRKPVAIWLIGS